ncbi:MAG: hypothetical protein IPK33_13065 [Gemmatimonadetes bacterium]|nr:hypothetical protein [Gemmatimonadota bacterium]
MIQPQPVDVNDTGRHHRLGTSSAAGVLYASAFRRNRVGHLLPAWPGATQTMARSINNNGEIVGGGRSFPVGQCALLWKVTTGSPPPPAARWEHRT